MLLSAQLQFRRLINLRIQRAGAFEHVDTGQAAKWVNDGGKTGKTAGRSFWRMLQILSEVLVSLPGSFSQSSPVR